MVQEQDIQAILAAWKAGDYSAALDLVRRRIALGPDRASDYAMLGRLLVILGRGEEAIVAYQQALAIDPGASMLHCALGNALAELGRVEAALESYRRALALQPDMVEAHGNIGMLMKNAGRVDEAIAALRRAVELRPNFAEAHSELGVELCKQNKWSDAIAHFRRAISIRPDYAIAHGNLGIALCGNKQHREGIASFQRCLELRPDEPEILFNLANAHYEVGDMQGAIVAYRRSLALKPDRAEGHHHLSQALSATGMYEEAADAMVACARLRPDDMGNYWNLHTAFQLKDSKQRVVELPDDLPALPYLGDKVVLLRCNRAARERLRRAGLHGGHVVNRQSGADDWLSILLAANQSPAELKRALSQWLEWVRNESAMSGTTCTLWLPEMPAAAEEIFRGAAGEDLIEIAGEDAGEIYSRLAARAAEPPDTEGKIFAVVSVRNGGLELLPHWLEHYTSLGVDEILLGVFDEVETESERQTEKITSRYRIRRFAQHWKTCSEDEQYAQRASACRRAGARPGTWIMHTDLDELHEYPCPIHRVVQAAAEQNVRAIYGNFMDRVAADGSLPRVLAEPTLWEQFPIECDLTQKILSGGTQKVMLARYQFRVSPGHHEALLAPPGPAPIGSADDYRVAHFKWHGDVKGRMQWGLEDSKPTAEWKGEARRFLAWLAAHDGRIDLSDPLLKARNRGKAG